MPTSFSLRIYGWFVVLKVKLFTTGTRSLCMVRTWDILKKLESNLAKLMKHLLRLCELYSDILQNTVYSQMLQNQR
jgi:hypothetical protein